MLLQTKDEASVNIRWRPMEIRRDGMFNAVYILFLKIKDPRAFMGQNSLHASAFHNKKLDIKCTYVCAILHCSLQAGYYGYCG
jgi:hypothetical protein